MASWDKGLSGEQVFRDILKRFESAIREGLILAPVPKLTFRVDKINPARHTKIGSSIPDIDDRA